ncbi:outer membrane protein assembly factor BamB family protein [Streptomyces abikoensis]|uniref:PQQ-binding-like beta-propeller repeat protein n=1 Tax=Streptomyces abikoensis TaxID=97398 RepID=A0ABW7SZB4_9ACTN
MSRQQQPSYPLPPLQPPPSPSPVTPPYSPGSGTGRRKLWITSLVLGVLLACGGGVYALWGGSDSPPNPSAAHDSGTAEAGAMVWKKTARTEPSRGANAAPGAWFTPTTVVKAEPDMMTAYDLKTGAKQWSLVLDGVLCAASRDADGDRVLIAVKAAGFCDGMAAIDIRRGVRLWSEPIALHTGDDPDLDNFRPDKWKAELEVAVNAGHGLITWATGAKIVSLTDGKPVGDSPQKEPCRYVGAAGGSQMLTLARCDKRMRVRSQNPEALDKPKWTWEGRGEEEVDEVLSTRPVVLLTSDGQGKPVQLVTLNDTDGKERSRIELRRDHDGNICSASVSKCPEYLIDGDTVYIARKGSTTAYDLANGREKWTYKADANRTAFPVSVRDGQLAVYVPGTPERVGELSRVSTRTGEAARTTHLARDLRAIEWRLARPRALVSHLKGDRLLLLNEGLLDSQDADVVVAVAAP